MRARNIKPGIFRNEILGSSDPLLTLLFEGLWCLADREGRLEDRHLRIKAEVFPYRENLDIHRYLTELERTGFVQRYKVGDRPGAYAYDMNADDLREILRCVRNGKQYADYRRKVPMLTPIPRRTRRG